MREKDDHQLGLEEVVRLHKEVKDQNQKLQMTKQTKVFTHRMVHYLAEAIGNKIQVSKASDHSPVDIIKTTHQAEQIECFDIAEVSKSIVSYSTLITKNPTGQLNQEHVLVVHGLADVGYLNGIDKKVSTVLTDLKKGNNLQAASPQSLRWTEFWRCDEKLLAIQGFLNSISISPIGDFFVLGGHNFMSVWTRDSSLVAHSYSMKLFQARTIPKDLIASALVKMPTQGQVIQTEISADGRAILSLEIGDKDQRTMRVYFNEQVRRITKGDAHLKPPKMGESIMPSLSKLDYFEVPILKRECITAFKLISWDLKNYTGGQREILPIVFLTLTSRGTAHLWVEDLNLPADYAIQIASQKRINSIEDEIEVNKQSKYLGMSFTCVHTIVANPRMASRASSKPFDLCHIRLESDYGFSSNYCQPLIDDMSALMNPMLEDYIQHFKVEQSTTSHKLFLGVIASMSSKNMKKTSQDFIAVSFGDQLTIFKISGLKNQIFSHQGVAQVSVLRTFKVDQQPQALILAAQNCLSQGILTLSEVGGYHVLGDFVDVLAVSTDNSLVKLSITQEDSNGSILQSKEISSLTSHGLVPRPAFGMEATESIAAIIPNSTFSCVVVVVHKADGSSLLKVFADRSDCGQFDGITAKNSAFLEDSLAFITSWRCSSKITRVQWSPSPIMSMMVLTADNKIALVQPQIVSRSIKSIIESEQRRDGSSSPVLLGEKLIDVWKQKGVQEQMHASVFDLRKLLVKEQALDFGVIEFAWSSSGCSVEEKAILEPGPDPCIAYRLKTVVFTEKTVDFIEFKIRDSGTTAREIDTTDYCSIPWGSKEKMTEVMAMQVVQDKNKMEYQESESNMKAVVQVVNEKNQYELKQLELSTDNKILEIWTMVLPGQAAVKIDEKPKLNPRGIPYPTKKAAPQPAGPKPLDYTIKVSLSSQLTGVLIQNVKKKQFNIFVYDHEKQNKYLGFIDLLQVLEYGELDAASLLKMGFPIDFIFPRGLDDSIVISCLDQVYYLAYSRITSQWRKLQKVEMVTGIDVRIIDDIKLTYFAGSLLFTANKTAITLISKSFDIFGDQKIHSKQEELIHDRVISKDDEEEPWMLKSQKEDDHEEAEQEEEHAAAEVNQPEHIFHLLAKARKNHPLFSPVVLRNLFVQGKIQFIMRILINMNKHLKAEIDLQTQMKANELPRSGKDIHISNTLGYTLAALLAEIDQIIDEQVNQMDQQPGAAEAEEAKKEPEQKKQVKQSNDFDDFFGGDDDDDDFDLMDDGMIDFDALAQKKKEEPSKKKEDQKKDSKPEQPQQSQKDQEVEIEFNKIFEELLKNTAESKELTDAGLLDFLLVFKSLYAKDFFSDVMATTLLRELFFDTEPIDREELKKITAKQEDEAQSEVVRKLENHEIYAQMYGENADTVDVAAYQQKNMGDLRLLTSWNSRQCALALFTVNQDVVIDELTRRFDLENTGNWEMFKKLSIPIWMKEAYKLRNMVEWIAKVAYKDAGDANQKKVGDGSKQASMAEQTSLWYLLINKKSVLISLFEKEKASGGDKVAHLLSQDFTQARWSKAACKNAMVLRQKQRFLLSATFFILGGDIDSALQIIRQSMKDPVLAILTCRMLELQQPDNKAISKALEGLYDEFFIQRGEKLGDVYLKSIGLWSQKKFVQAVNALQKAADQSSTSASGRKNYTIASGSSGQTGSLFDTSLKQFQLTYAGDEASPRAITSQASTKAVDSIMPLASENVGYELQLMITKLKKAHQVTHALKAASDQGTGYGADTGDLLGDFFGGPSAGAASKDKNKKEEEKLALEIDGEVILNELLQVSLERSDTFNGLFLLRSNRDLIQPKNPKQMALITSLLCNVMQDQIEEVRENPTYLAPSDSLRSQLLSLVNFIVGPSPEEAMAVLKNRLVRQGEQFTIETLQKLQGLYALDSGSNILARYELELRLEARHEFKAYCATLPKLSEQLIIPRPWISLKHILNRLEAQSSKFLSFISNFASRPLSENESRWHLPANMEQIQNIILEMEQHVDCLIIWDHYEDEHRRNSQADEQDQEVLHQDTKEIEFFAIEEEEAAAPPTKEAPGKPSATQSKQAHDDMFDDLMGGDDSDDDVDLMDFDFDTPSKKVKEIPTFKTTGASASAPILKKSPSRVEVRPKGMAERLEEIQRVLFQVVKLRSKLRASIVMNLALVVLAMQLNKFYITKDLLLAHDFKHITEVDASQLDSIEQRCKAYEKEILASKDSGLSAMDQQLAIDAIEKRVHELNLLVNFSTLKTYVQKFKCSVEKKIVVLGDLVRDVKHPKKEFGDSIFQVVEEQGNENGEGEIELDENIIDDCIFFEKFEHDLLNGEEIAETLKAEPYSGENGSSIKRTLGILSKQAQVVPQTFFFLRTWLKFIVVNKTKELLEDSFLASKAEHQEVGYLHKVAPKGCDRDQSLSLFAIPPELVQTHPEIEDYQIHMSRVDLHNELVDLQKSLFSRQFIGSELVQQFRRAARSLEDECSLQFQSQLNVLQRMYIVKQLNKINKSLMLRPVLLHYFFKTQEKLQDFFKEFQVEARYSKPLLDQHLAILAHSYTADTDQREREEGLTYPPAMPFSKERAPTEKQAKSSKQEITITPSASHQLIRDLQGAGIELFKQRGEQINDFAFDNSDATNNIAIAMLAAGIREIPGLNTLLFRNRVESGLQLIDEENLKWEECLHRYNEIEPLIYEAANKETKNRNIEILTADKDEPIIQTIDSLYADKTIFSRTRPLERKPLVFTGYELNPPTVWNGESADRYMSQLSRLDITHEDYTFPVESHPSLPIYITGNRRGILCTWKFGQQADKSLYQFFPEIDPRSADPKKACVKKIQFSRSGDKIMSNNMEGSLSIYKFECQSKGYRKVPIFSLHESVDSKVTDFDFINGENVFCVLSQKSKAVKVYDTLLPYNFGKQAQVMEFKLSNANASGNLVQFNPRTQSIYTFNGRTGAMTELDLRMNCNVVNSVQMSQSSEVTAVCLSSNQDSLITGYKDGIVKIHSVVQQAEQPVVNTYRNQKAAPQPQNQLYLRERIDAFPFDFRSKKGTVQRIKINQKTGGVFASSQSGILKLIRTSV